MDNTGGLVVLSLKGPMPLQHQRRSVRSIKTTVEREVRPVLVNQGPRDTKLIVVNGRVQAEVSSTVLSVCVVLTTGNHSFYRGRVIKNLLIFLFPIKIQEKARTLTVIMINYAFSVSVKCSLMSSRKLHLFKE